MYYKDYGGNDYMLKCHVCGEYADEFDMVYSRDRGEYICKDCARDEMELDDYEEFEMLDLFHLDDDLDEFEENEDDNETDFLAFLTLSGRL